MNTTIKAPQASMPFYLRNKGQVLSNILKTENGFRLELLVPGWKKEELSLTFEGHQLIVQGRKTELEASFTKKFNLATTIDAAHIAAKVENGIMYIELPVKEVPIQKIELA